MADNNRTKSISVYQLLSQAEVGRNTLGSPGGGRTAEAAAESLFDYPRTRHIRIRSARERSQRSCQIMKLA